MEKNRVEQGNFVVVRQGPDSVYYTSVPGLEELQQIARNLPTGGRIIRSGLTMEKAKEVWARETADSLLRRRPASAEPRFRTARVTKRS